MSGEEDKKMEKFHFDANEKLPVLPVKEKCTFYDAFVTGVPHTAQ